MGKIVRCTGTVGVSKEIRRNAATVAGTERGVALDRAIRKLNIDHGRVEIVIIVVTSTSREAKRENVRGGLGCSRQW